MTTKFRQPDMPTMVGYFHAWHNNSTCDFNRYRHVIIQVISIDNILYAISPFDNWHVDDNIIAWGDRISNPNPPPELFENYNNVTKFKFKTGRSEFLFDSDDLPPGSKCQSE